MRATLSEPDIPGLLAYHVASNLMKVLDGAGVGRWDLLKVATLVATYIAKCITRCEQALHRFMSYASSATEWTLSEHEGDPAENLSQRLTPMSPYGLSSGM